MYSSRRMASANLRRRSELRRSSIGTFISREKGISKKNWRRKKKGRTITDLLQSSFYFVELDDDKEAISIAKSGSEIDASRGNVCHCGNPSRGDV
jgi:hypothetical protein